MMGQQSAGQEHLLYSFNLEDHVPQNHLLRGIDCHLDLTDLRQHLSGFYSHTGRPFVDPDLMIRMSIVGYCFGIRSERRLCEEVHLNLAHRWFCRLGLETRCRSLQLFQEPTRSVPRERYFSPCVRGGVAPMHDRGLVGGEGFAIDASVVKADASRQRGLPGGELIDWKSETCSTRAVREYLAALEEINPSGAPPKSSH